MADLLDFTPVRILTADAAPGAAYTVTFYLSGTTTPATVYQDAGLSIPFSSTISADGNGDFPAIYNGGTALKAVIQDALGGTVATVDPVRRSSLTATGAAGVSFAPTIALPFTNVQAAIEGSVAAAASGYQTYGLAVTGSATLLANIDATNIASGAYRFDATTIGTFPTQSAAANTGIIETWRETSGSAVMFLYDDTLNVFWFRRMASSAWGAWREVIMSDQGSVQGDILYRGATNWTRLAKGTAAQVLTMNGGATAPAWATAGVGGGQTWQDVKASRALATTYTNSTGKPIFVSIAVVWGNATGSVTLTIDGIIVQKFWSNPDSSDMSLSVSAIVPNGSTYSVAQTSNVAAGVIEYWAELR